MFVVFIGFCDEVSSIFELSVGLIRVRWIGIWDFDFGIYWLF